MNDTRRRATRQRAAITAVVEEADSFLTAQEIHQQLLARGERVGLTTVYRTLPLLIEDGVLDVLHPGEGETIYRSCGGAEHHHHLVCRSCRRAVEIESDEIEAWTRRIANRHGFTSPTHTVEVFGLCRDCTS